MSTQPKISIIGGSGFVGTNLSKKLKDMNVPFEIIDIKKSEQFSDKWKFGDVRDINTIRDAITGNIVVALAAVHRDDIRDKREYYLTNVDGTRNIAKVCSEKKIKKIIFTSSVAVYGFAPPGTDEKGEIRPFNEYGRTKYLGEEKLNAWFQAADNKLIIVRPTVIFGEGNRGNVFNLFNQISSGRFLMVGSGANLKSMAYIGNVVEFLISCIKTEREYAVFNYVDSPAMDMNTLVSQVRNVLLNKEGVGIRVPYWIGISLGYVADAVSAASRKTLPLSSIRVRKFCSSTLFESQSQELSGFIPPFSLAEGINRTLKSEFVSPDPNREIFFSE